MAAKPAARTMDPLQHGLPLAAPGSANVTINGLGAFRALTDAHTCPTHGAELVTNGASTVRINGMWATREGDFLIGKGAPNRIMHGSANVVIGAPDLGLASPANRAKFCASFCALKKDWATLTPAERRKRYEALAAEAFASFGAPPPTVADDVKPGRGIGATFGSTEWKIGLPQGTFESSDPPSGKSLFHECRHGEQSFGAARTEAGKDGPGKPPPSVGDLHDQMAIPRNVAEAARQNPASPGSDDARWGSVFASELGTKEGQEVRQRVTDEVWEASEAEPIDAARLRRAAEGYARRPQGSDAHDVDGYGECGGCK